MSLFLKYLSVFFISMVPLLELRGAIPIAIGMGLETMASILVCTVGNLVPVPVIYLFARKVLLWGLDKPYIGGFCRFCHEKGEGAGRKLAGGRFGRFGLMIALMAFVGATQSLEVVWNISDIFNALMAFPNLVALVALSGVIAAETKKGMKTLK